MCELVWGEPGRFLKKRWVRRKHPLYLTPLLCTLHPPCTQTCGGAEGEGEVGAAYPTAAEARVAAGARLRRALNSVTRDT